MSPAGLVQALGWALLHSLWQLSLLGLLAAALLVLAGGQRPRAQYAIAYGALLLCLLWPMATLLIRLAQAQPLPALALEWLPTAAGGAQLAVPAPVASNWASRALGLLRPRLDWLAGAWALGVLVMGLRLAGGYLLTLRWRREAQAAEPAWQERLGRLALTLGVRGRVTLLASVRVASPVVLGLWRPVVLVPAGLFTGMPPAYLEALLAHELAHVARFDYLFNLVQLLVELFCFYHPVVWWLSRRVRTLREHLCDDLACQALGEPRRLALALDTLDDLQPHLNPCNNPLALAASGGPLLTRIQRLLTPGLPVDRPSWTPLLLALVLPCATLALRAAALEPAPIPGRPEIIQELDALAAKEGLDPNLLRAIAWAESDLSPKAKSSLGATGLLQVMPATAQKFGATDLADPAQVAAAGARYLRFLQDRYPGDLAKVVAAYNGGEAAVDAGQLSAETTNYRRLVLELLQAKAVQPAPALADGGVDGVLRRSSDGLTWTLDARINARGAMHLELLPEPGPGAPTAAYGRVKTAGSGPMAVDRPWQVLRPKVMLKIPQGQPFWVRCSLPELGLVGEAHFVQDSDWKTFAFTMAPVQK